MADDKFVDLHEDIYILEAAGLKRIAITDGFLRMAAVEIDSRCAYSVSAQQITYVSEKTPFLQLYPDPKQVSVFRMLIADGTLREFWLLDPNLQKEVCNYWISLQFEDDDAEKREEVLYKYGKILMSCSNTAFESMDMNLIPEPGQDSKYWDRMVEVADSLKGLNSLGHFYK